MQKIKCGFSIMIAIVILLLLTYIVFTNNDKRIKISDMASIVMDSEWSIESKETKKGYSYSDFLYSGKKVATIEFSEVNAMSLFSKDTTAESFTRIYIGMHAELKDSSEVKLKKRNTSLTKIVVNPGMSAAERENSDVECADEIWYFGISENNIMICAQLLDVSEEETFEKVLSTLVY